MACIIKFSLVVPFHFMLLVWIGMNLKYFNSITYIIAHLLDQRVCCSCEQGDMFIGGAHSCREHKKIQPHTCINVYMLLKHSIERIMPYFNIHNFCTKITYLCGLHLGFPYNFIHKTNYTQNFSQHFFPVALEM